MAVKVVKKLRIPVPFSSSEDVNAPRDEQFHIITKLLKKSDSERYTQNAIDIAAVAEARAALANAKVAVLEAKSDEARALAEAEVTKLTEALDVAQQKVPAKPFNIIEDRVLAVEGLEGEDDQGNDLSDTNFALPYLLEDLRMSAAATRAIFDSVNTLKTGN